MKKSASFSIDAALLLNNCPSMHEKQKKKGILNFIFQTLT